LQLPLRRILRSRHNATPNPRQRQPSPQEKLRTRGYTTSSELFVTSMPVRVMYAHVRRRGPMANTQIPIAEAYAAFNRRDIDAALALMSENVSWPKASEGGRAVGKEEIRAYWTRQWKQFDPHVEPIEAIERGAGRVDVRVHQLVKSLGGDVLSDSEVWHAYTIANGLIERMDIKESETSGDPAPSAAFSGH